MKRVIKYVIFAFLFLLIPLNNIYAKCSDDEKQLYKENAGSFSYVSKFDETTKSFKITFYNPLPDIFEFKYSYTKNITCTDLSDYEKSCSNFKSGQLIIVIKGKTNTCNDKMYSDTYSLKYNYFYNDPICEGASEFVLCSPTYDKDITYEDFVYSAFMQN